ncbi:hypothetical protein DES37_11084 [Mangrovibacter plantisponsor]|uniref:Uncharacterized protein n=1 Tax=Mangrovibacter plantisponsor TaxID=451513 RepID=A0A317PYJ9_9ENTR|nr:hypothetical protein DES37_11084 [Mangrovibacter plantisponsor]
MAGKARETERKQESVSNLTIVGQEAGGCKGPTRHASTIQRPHPTPACNISAKNIKKTYRVQNPQPHLTAQKSLLLAARPVRVRPVNRRKEDKVIPPGRRNKANRGMDAESSRPQADCPEVNAVRSTGRPRKRGLQRGEPPLARSLAVKPH